MRIIILGFLLVRSVNGFCFVGINGFLICLGIIEGSPFCGFKIEWQLFIKIGLCKF